MIIAPVLWNLPSAKTTDDNYNAYAVAINILSATQQRSILHAGRLFGGRPRGTDCKKYIPLSFQWEGCSMFFVCLFVFHLVAWSCLWSANMSSIRDSNFKSRLFDIFGASTTWKLFSVERNVWPWSIFLHIRIGQFEGRKSKYTSFNHSGRAESSTKWKFFQPLFN